MHDGDSPIPDNDHPPTPAWITPALLAHTIAVWSQRYGRAVSHREAVELLVRMGRLLDVLVRTATCETPARSRADNE